MLGGCSGSKKLTPTEQASGDPAYRKIKDLCEQEALGQCWKQADSSPLYLNEIWQNYKQSKCKKEWVTFCMEKHGYSGKR